MVVPQRQKPKLNNERQKQHDFSRDKDRCAKCGMPLSVWKDPRVPCPGKRYSIKVSHLWAIARWACKKGGHGTESQMCSSASGVVQLICDGWHERFDEEDAARALKILQVCGRARWPSGGRSGAG